MSFRDDTASPQGSSAPSAAIRASRLQDPVDVNDKPIPSVKLWFLPGEAHRDLASFVGERSLVIYFFPGLESQEDVAQARAFRNYSLEWVALDYGVLGISSQSPDSLQKWGTQMNCPYDLASDYSLQLADELGLRTQSVGGVRVYERLTLIASDGKLREVVSPVASPEREAAVVSEWLNRSMGPKK
jgi:peroxiredoxin